MTMILVIIVLLFLLCGLVFLWQQERMRRKQAIAELRKSKRVSEKLRSYIKKASKVNAGAESQIERLREVKSDEELDKEIGNLLTSWNAGE